LQQLMKQRSSPFRIVTDIIMMAFMVIFPLVARLHLLVYAPIIVLVCWLYLVLYSEKFKDLGFSFSQLSWQPALFGSLIALGYALVEYYVAGAYRLKTPGFSTAFTAGMKPAVGKLLILVITWVVAAPYEEIIFRGFMLKRTQAMMKGSWRLGISVLINSLLFGMYHIQQGIHGVMNAVIFSLAAGVLYKLFKGNLWYNIFFHAAYNTVMFVILN